MKRSFQYDGTRYRINLLWKNNITMPNNYFAAKAQVESLNLYNDDYKMRNSRCNSTKNPYHLILIKLRDTRNFSTSATIRIRYLPHHLVINPQKPGKFQRVTNAASKFKGFSLNSCLETGPDLPNNMFGLLMSFKEKQRAVSGDLEGIFVQIGKEEDGQNVLRFLWPTKEGVKQYQY